jgi:hypothetical protein
VIHQEQYLLHIVATGVQLNDRFTRERMKKMMSIPRVLHVLHVRCESDLPRWQVIKLAIDVSSYTGSYTGVCFSAKGEESRLELGDRLWRSCLKKASRVLAIGKRAR